MKMVRPLRWGPWKEQTEGKGSSRHKGREADVQSTCSGSNDSPLLCSVPHLKPPGGELSPGPRLTSAICGMGQTTRGTCECPFCGTSLSIWPSPQAHSPSTSPTSAGTGGLQLLSMMPPGAQGVRVPVPPSLVRPTCCCVCSLVKLGVFGLLSPAVQSDASSQATGQRSLGIGDLQVWEVGEVTNSYLCAK